LRDGGNIVLETGVRINMACGCSLLAYLGLWQLLGTTPRTVSFEIDAWSNDSWGLHNIEREQTAGTVMVFADGSRVNNVTAKYYKHYFVPAGEWTTHTVYVRPTNLAYQVDDKAKTATLWRCTCTWEELEPPGPDAACISAAHFHLGESVTQVRMGEVAGASVIWYKKTGSNADDEAAFAPRFGCDILEERRAKYNGIGLPTSRYHFVVRSYLAGNPAQTALAPPAAYLVTEERRTSR
jgi:hypothetical protein